MAARNGVQRLVIQELQELKNELKQVRQSDIPNILVDIAGMKKELGSSSKLYASIGGGIAVLISAVMYLWK